MSDDEDLELGHNPDTYEPARLGVPVWRVIIDDRAIVTDDPRIADAYSHSDSRARIVEPGLWFATTPEAVAELRELLTRDEHPYLFPDQADAVLRAMGFTDA